MSSRNNCLMMEPLALLSECNQEFRKARGHGGQKVNKTSVAVRITHRETGLTATEDSSRSQTENRLHALRKLQWEMVLKLRENPVLPEGFVPDSPPSVNNVRRLLWSAIVLDFWAASGWEPKETAEKLGISTSRLIRLMYRDPVLWQEINHSREQLGLHSLKGN